MGARRRQRSDEVERHGLVDWELLVLFMGLFVVNDALQRTGLPSQLVAASAAMGLRLDHPAPLFGAAFFLSNIVSNVPAVMLLVIIILVVVKPF